MTIDERIGQLERTNRKWRWTALTLAVVLGLLAIVAWSQNLPKAIAAPTATRGVFDVVQTRQLELIDENGKVRGLLIPGGIVLSGSKTQAQVTIGADDTFGGAVYVSNPNGKAVVTLIPVAGAGGSVVVANAAGNNVIVAQANSANNGVVLAGDANGKIQAGLDGTPR